MSETYGKLNAKQVEVLFRPINPIRVMVAQNQSHLPAFDVVAHLTRIFGFEGWDKEILDISLVSETLGHPLKPDKKQWYVTYRCLMRLTIRDPHGNVVKVIEDGATGTASNLPDLGDAHDFAYKNAISYAIKRCAKDLGDQFGLSLYNKGSKQRLIGSSMAYEGEAKAIEENIPTPMSMGNDERVEWADD